MRTKYPRGLSCPSVTRTNAADWAYPTTDGVEIRAKPEAGAAVVEKLGMVMVRILPDENPSGDWLKLVAPSGKAGYAAADLLAPVGSDQLCYQKDGGGWKIAGYIGAGTGQDSKAHLPACSGASQTWADIICATPTDGLPWFAIPPIRFQNFHEVRGGNDGIRLPGNAVDG